MILLQTQFILDFRLPGTTSQDEITSIVETLILDLGEIEEKGYSEVDLGQNDRTFC